MRKALFVAVVAVAGVTAVAQEKEDRTLLSAEQMTAIINEASGERAMHHVLRAGAVSARPAAGGVRRALPRKRGDGALAKEYGFSNVTIEDYRRPGRPGSRRRASCG